MSRPKNELSSEIENLLKTEKPETVFEFIKTTHQTDKIENATLARLFIAYIEMVGWEDAENGISPVILMESLCEINTYFRTTNGNQWARSDSGIIGRKYIINREIRSGQVYSIQLAGFNTSFKSSRGIKRHSRYHQKSKVCCFRYFYTDRS